MSRKTIVLIIVGIAVVVVFRHAQTRKSERENAANIVQQLQRDLPYCKFETTNKIPNIPISWKSYETKEGLSFSYPPDMVLDSGSLTIHPKGSQSVMEIEFEPVTPVEGGKDAFLSRKMELGTPVSTDSQVKIGSLPTSVTRMMYSSYFQDLYLAFPEETCLVQVTIRPSDSKYKDQFEKIMGTFSF